MKIAMIGQKSIPSRIGGVEIHVEEIAKRLVKQGHNVTVYCRKSYSKNNIKKYEGINLKYIPTINTKHLDAIIYTFISSVHAVFNNFDIIHYHALGPSTLAFIPRILRRKVVCTVHGLDWQRSKWGGFAKKYLKFGEYASAKFSHKIITVSNSLKEYYNEKYNSNSVYIPNGVEIPSLKKADVIAKKYRIKKDGYILFLARLVPEKGVHYLIDAFNSIKTNKKLIIAGGSSHTDNYVAKLKRQADKNPNIIFTGFVKGKELDELFGNAYIYILPSEIEGMPISLLEAMSYKQCCLVSNIPENLETIQQYGYSFLNKNAYDLADKIQLLIDNENLVKEMKEKVLYYVCKEYNWDTISLKTEEVYKSLL